MLFFPRIKFPPVVACDRCEAGEAFRGDLVRERDTACGRFCAHFPSCSPARERRVPPLPRQASGFTLLELLAVISIIAVLAAMVIGVGRRATETGRTARTKAELAALAAALENYQRTFGDYPRTDDGAQLLQALIGRRGPGNATTSARSLLETARFETADSRDPFVDPAAALIDPWGRPYRYAYKVPAAGWTNSTYVLYSAGPDGQDSPASPPGGFPDMTATGNADNLYANRH